VKTVNNLAKSFGQKPTKKRMNVYVEYGGSSNDKWYTYNLEDQVHSCSIVTKKYLNIKEAIHEMLAKFGHIDWLHCCNEDDYFVYNCNGYTRCIDYLTMNEFVEEFTNTTRTTVQ